MNIEDLYMTRKEAMEYLNVSESRFFQIRNAGYIEALKGGVYSRASVEAYKLKRGDKKGGRYPKE
jgi:hypothetical protein